MHIVKNKRTRKIGQILLPGLGLWLVLVLGGCAMEDFVEGLFAPAGEATIIPPEGIIVVIQGQSTNPAYVPPFNIGYSGLNPSIVPNPFPRPSLTRGF